MTNILQHVSGILATYSQGSKRILTAPGLTTNLQICLKDIHPMVQAQAANTIEIMSRIPWGNKSHCIKHALFIPI